MRGRRKLWIALLVPLALVAGSCGSSDKKSAAPSQKEEAFDPNAVLHLQFNLSSDQAGLNFDPAKAFSGADMQVLVYDSLLRNKPDGTTEPGLAKSVKVVDPQTIDIELQP